MSPIRTVALVLIAAAPFTTPAFATFTFSDNFDSGLSPDWSNLRGGWYASGGVINAQLPSNAPPTNTSVRYSLADLTLDVDVSAMSDGGIWLHTDAGAHNGVLLVTGGGGWGSGNRDGQSGNSLYFHVIHNDAYSSPTGRVTAVFTPGTNHHLRVTIAGGTYSVFLDNAASPITSLSTPDFPMGRVGLYDYSSIQTFDNFSVTSTTIPGDANGNGRIDPDDFALTDRGLARHLAGFSNGDFDADGAVTAADYAILDASLARQSAAAPLLAIPEPASLLTLCCAAPLLVRRRPPHSRAELR